MASSSSRSMLSAAIRPIASSSKQPLPPVVARFNSTNSPLPSASLTSTSPSAPIILSFPLITPLPRPHNIHCATLHLQAHHPYPLDLYTQFALHAANSLGIPTSNPASLPTSRSLYTVLKGPFIHKKAQENFERRTHKRAIKVWDADPTVIDLWLRYLKRNGIGGVGMKATLYEWEEVGFGQREIAELEKELKTPGKDVQEVAKRLLGDLQGDIAASEESSEGAEAPKEDQERQGGKELVEGSDDVVAGEDLPAAHPEAEAAEHTPSEADGGSRGPNHQ